MITLDDSLVSSSRRRLELRLRRDLTIRQHFYQNKSSWVVKDPLSLKFYRFNDEEYAIVQLLDGSHSLEDIKFEFERRFAPNQVSVERLWQFIASLHQGGLLLAETSGQGQQLKKRRDERQHKELMAKVISPLSIKFRGINPDPILNVLYPMIRWVYSPIVVVLCVAVMFAALLLVTVQHAVLAARLPAFHEFFSFQSAIWMMLALSLSKVIHEFGHALTCKHFGGECHEMGMMFLVLTPAAYCNVSDAWMLSNKWHRIAISVAGIYSDLMIASISTFLWWYSGPGLFNHFCLNLMFVCSVSTLLFNANPLMRFDGYYVLADLVEIPNLMQKASSVLARTLQIVCLGIKPPPDPMLPQRNHGFFIAYAIGVTVYRWVIVISITMFLTQVFKPYGLQIFGQMLAAFSIGGMTIRPLFKVIKYLKAPGRWATVKKPRLITTFVFLGIVAAVVAGVPFSHSVYCPLEIRPSNSVQVYVDESGIIERVHVRAGDRVRQGDRLVDLSSSALDLEESRLNSQREAIESRLRQLHRQSFADPNVGSQVAETEASLAAVKQQIQLSVAKRARLQITAPVAGMVMSAPDKAARREDDSQLPSRSGALMLDKNVGSSVEPGELICLLATSGAMEAVAVVDQGDLEFVLAEQTVKMKLEHLPDTLFSGRIQRIATEDLRSTPIQLTIKGGGSVATMTDASGRERPESSLYAARIKIEEDGGLLRVGMRGEAKILTAPRTLWQRLVRTVQRTFHFAM